MKRNSVFTYLHNDHLGSPVLTTSSSATASQVYYAYGKVRSYSGSFPIRYQFTGQHIDDSDLTYMNARYYDRRTGQFISPDTLVPDAGLLVDYNRFMYARGNPMRFTDPSGHCATFHNGEPDWDSDRACWQLAYQIYGFSSRASFARDWKITGDEWLETFAKEEYANVEYLKPLADQYYTEWAREVGLPVDKVVWHEPPRQSVLPMCETWDCPAIALDVGSLVTSVGSDAIAVGCVAVSGGSCLVAVAGLKAIDIAISIGSFAYTADQYYRQGSASDLDLAVALTGLVSIVPGVGEASDIISLAWDLGDPFVDDERRWPPGVAR